MSNVAGIDPTKTTDHYDLDDIDATHPANLNYLVPAQATGIIRVTLSWKMGPFRSTVNLNPSTIGTDATGSSGHNHGHSHSIPIDLQGVAANVSWPSGGASHLASSAGPGTAPTNADATGETGHSHSHSHTLTGASQQGVTDGLVGTVAAVSFDGVDQTAALGGPWPGDMVELDVSSVFQKAAGTWHQISLTPSGLTRITTLLRIYYTTS